MNARYLYRAKRKNWRGLPKEKWWVEGYYAYMQPYHYIMPKDNFDSWIEIDEKTLCACTGLKDKNGKMIWENDIVSFQFDNDDCPFPNKDTKKRIGKVFFSDFRASWSITMGKNGSKSLNNDLWKYVQNGNRVEVIGNIFDNQELLE